jgi:hypothetical protein
VAWACASGCRGRGTQICALRVLRADGARVDFEVGWHEDAGAPVIAGCSGPARPLRPAPRAFCAGAEALGEFAICEPDPVHERAPRKTRARP